MEEPVEPASMDGCAFHSSWPSSASRKMWGALQTGADGVVRHTHLSEGRRGVETRASACRSADGQDGASHGPAEVTTTRECGEFIPPSTLSWLKTVQKRVASAPTEPLDRVHGRRA